jgi:hypothetical protein
MSKTHHTHKQRKYGKGQQKKNHSYFFENPNGKFHYIMYVPVELNCLNCSCCCLKNVGLVCRRYPLLRALVQVPAVTDDNDDDDNNSILS